MTKKNFSDSLAAAVSVLSEGKLNAAEPAAFLTPEEAEQLQELQKKKPNKILLRIDPDLQAVLQTEARKIAAAEDRNYSLTELINDVLRQYVSRL